MKELKKIDEQIVHVLLKSGAVVYLQVPIYEGKGFTECLKIRSNDIIGYFDGANLYYINFNEMIKTAEQFDKAVRKDKR